MSKTDRANARALEINSDTITLVETIQRLENEKEQLRQELWGYKRKPTGKIGYMLLFFGTITLVFSIIYASQVPAFIGISLIFWGTLLLFIKPTNYIKAQLLKSTVMPTFLNINKIITNLNYRGNGIYLPPKYSKEFKGGTVFIPTEEENTIPPLEEVDQEKVFLENPNGMYLTPSGLDLTNMFEEELGINFSKSNLDSLQDDLHKLFIDGLEIAETFEMKKQENNIQVIITNSIYNDFCIKAQKLTKNACISFACPLCSSIACALTRVTGKPVIIKENSVSADNKTIQISYQILGQIMRVSTPSKPTILRTVYPLRTVYHLVRRVDLISATLGSIILACVCWLIMYDITVWGKDLAFIFFSSRTGEVISLGIGMRVIHYFLLGLALFLPTIIILFFKKRTQVHIED